MRKPDRRPHRPKSPLAWLFGYFEAEIPRIFCEPFLNLCMRYGITYYSLDLDEERKIFRVRVPVSERRRLLAACRAWQIRIKICNTRGLPHRIAALRGRWGLAVGMFLAVSLIILSGSVIWRIDIVGNETLPTDRVLEVLSENGIAVGARISEISAESAEQKIMISTPEISWISVSLHGTVARVEVREQLTDGRSEASNAPANLVSDFDAQIVELEIYSGFVGVKEGDFVRRGDLLVSGIYRTENAPSRYTRASGRVIGKVRCTFEVHIPLNQTEKVPTGEKISQKTLIFFGKTIKLFTNCGKIPPTCDIISCKYTLDPFSLGELPVCLLTREYYPYEERSRTVTESEAIEQAYAELYLQIEKTLPEARILKKELAGELRDGEYVLECTVTALCNIARQADIEILGE